MSATSAAAAGTAARPAAPQPAAHPAQSSSPATPTPASPRSSTRSPARPPRSATIPASPSRARRRRCRCPALGAVELVDLPGTYSLSARSRDEQVAVDAVLGRIGPRPRRRHRRRRRDGARAQPLLRQRGDRDRHPRRRRAQHDGRGGSAGYSRVGRQACRPPSAPRSCRWSRRSGKGLADLAAAVARAIEAQRGSARGRRRWRRDRNGHQRARRSRGSPRSAGDSEAARRALGDLAAALARRRGTRRSERHPPGRAQRTPRASGRARCKAGRDLDQEIIGGRYAHVDAAVARGRHRRRRQPGSRGPSASIAS